jgi:hypothetical protein
MSHFKLATIFTSLLLLAVLSGCNNNKQPAPASKAAAESGPNLSFCRPKKLSAAIARLQEMHEVLLAPGDFPSPVKVDYVEVIHGTGPSGHSHYYLAADYEAQGEGHDEHGGHHHEDEAVKHSVLELDLQSELTNIVAWLPDLAAKSDLGESDWKTVSAVSKRLKEIISAIPSDPADAAFRESWTARANEIQTELEQLNKIEIPAAGETK